MSEADSFLSYRELFDKRKKYDSVLVWQSRHPSLNEYLGRALECIAAELQKGSLQKVALVIKEANLSEEPLERFVFDFDWLIPDEYRGKMDRDWTLKSNGITRAEVLDHLRAFLLKLNAADSYLLPLPQPPGITFGIVIELKDDADPPESDRARKGHVPVEWIPAEERHAPYKMGGPASMQVDGDDSTDDRSTVAPLKTTRLGMINMQMLVEELNGKHNLEEERREREELVFDRKGKGKAVQ
ncbi:mitotic spindle assembly checkpoint protein MAD2B, partial [Phenoliferia sp. Uapishka_3]